MTAIVGSKNLAALKLAACTAVDMAAENARQLWISPGGGQAMVYVHKLTEAQAFVVAYPLRATSPASPDAVNWPYMSAETGITGTLMWDVAQAVIARANAWVTASRQIEATRLGAKRAINAAASPAAVTTASQVTWPT